MSKLHVQAHIRVDCMLDVGCQLLWSTIMGCSNFTTFWQQALPPMGVGTSSWHMFREKRTPPVPLLVLLCSRQASRHGCHRRAGCIGRLHCCAYRHRTSGCRTQRQLALAAARRRGSPCCRCDRNHCSAFCSAMPTAQGRVADQAAEHTPSSAELQHCMHAHPARHTMPIPAHHGFWPRRLAARPAAIGGGPSGSGSCGRAARRRPTTAPTSWTR